MFPGLGDIIKTSTSVVWNCNDTTNILFFFFSLQTNMQSLRAQLVSQCPRCCLLERQRRRPRQLRTPLMGSTTPSLTRVRPSSHSSTTTQVVSWLQATPRNSTTERDTRRHRVDTHLRDTVRWYGLHIHTNSGQCNFNLVNGTKKSYMYVNQKAWWMLFLPCRFAINAVC